MSVYERLRELNIKLPDSIKPAASYVMAVQTGSNLYVSGHIPRRHGQPWVGVLGINISIEDAGAAARSVALDLLSTLHDQLGSLDRIKRIVKAVVLVNSGPEFQEQHIVANGFSETLVEILGDVGKHARSAFGVAQLPMGVCVEVELVVEVKSV
ncbi:Endoribonuclease L-PSP [compost metagenome]